MQLGGEHYKRTKIVATIGPASQDIGMLRAMVRAGMDVARINFSHGDHETHARNIENVKALPAQYLNVVDLLNAHHVVMSEDAVRKCEALWGGVNVKPQRGRTREAV